MLVRQRVLLPILVAMAAPAWLAAQDAHVHGVSRLEVAVDGEMLHLGVHLPGLDAVGFEQPADTDERRAAVVAAADRLKATDGWLGVMPEGACHVTNVRVDASGFGVVLDSAAGGIDTAAVASGAHEHGRDDHDHDHDHDHHHADGHDHDRHAGLVAMVEARCTGVPSAIDVRLAQLFPSVEMIQADLITAAGQSRAVLAGGETRISLE